MWLAGVGRCDICVGPMRTALLKTRRPFISPSGSRVLHGCISRRRPDNRLEMDGQPSFTTRALSMYDPESMWWPLALSTMAGLSTTIGGLFAVIRKPSQGAMAGLLGAAIGVMATISIVELIVRNAMENNALLVVASAGSGALAYYLLEPFFPKADEEDSKKQCDPVGTELTSIDSDPEAARLASSGPRKKVRKAVVSGHALGATGTTMQADLEDQRHNNGLSNGQTLRTASQALEISGSPTPGNLTKQSSYLGTTTSPEHGAMANGASGPRDQTLLHVSSPGEGTVSLTGSDVGAVEESSPGSRTASGSHTHNSASLMRLGLLMATTMTLHNMPEGFAVAFSAFTDFGPMMAIAIALHNIPEGIIIAAPIYAATNSRWKAVGLATASGLSEPLGAVLALLLLRPFITPDRLNYMLACVGGLMLAVCVIELWPEARACRNDRALALGALVGAAVMGWTLSVEG